MLKSWRLGQLFGFPIEISLSFILLLGVVFVAFGGLAGVLIVSLTFASVVLHELGHALVARKLGVNVSGIELSFFGGAAKMTDMPRTANHELAIASAGPAVSLMLGGAGLGLAALAHSPFLAMIGWINLVLAGFNLIPALPMDGGRILRALLTKRMSFVRATDIAVTVSRVAAVAFAIIGLMGAYQLLFLAPFLWLLGTRERYLARMMPDTYAGRSSGGVDVFRRGEGPFRGGGFRSSYSEPQLRRFTVRQVGGRLVIVPLD